MNVKELTLDCFEQEVLQADLPVIVDFWATWCGPCRAQTPILDTYGEANEGKVKIFKVNVDEQPELAARFQIASIPTLLIFKKNAPVKSLVGLHSQDQIAAAVGV